MKLGEFIEKFIEPNSLIRLVYKDKGGHETVLSNWDDCSMEWELAKCKGVNRHYINNEVLGVTGILITSGRNIEAINIVIERLENQPFITEAIDEVVCNTECVGKVD